MPFNVVVYPILLQKDLKKRILNILGVESKKTTTTGWTTEKAIFANKVPSFCTMMQLKSNIEKKLCRHFCLVQLVSFQNVFHLASTLIYISFLVRPLTNCSGLFAVTTDSGSAVHDPQYENFLWSNLISFCVFSWHFMIRTCLSHWRAHTKKRPWRIMFETCPIKVLNGSEFFACWVWLWSWDLVLSSMRDACPCDAPTSSPWKKEKKNIRLPRDWCLSFQNCT